jgi:hypothetical protein
VLRPKRGKVTRKCRKLHNEEPDDPYSSPNIRVIKSRKICWVGHVAGRGDVYTGFWWRNLRARDHLEDPAIDGGMIVRWIFRKWDGGGGERGLD